ncbi:MAG: helix-turn-helix transcriptional regulator [Caulobacterales bacterium]|jgi:transcriptional regulator with XRE-family HTH domain|nr:helix-turn-helix transcriptional regulator [Caulobacterales bacterium]
MDWKALVGANIRKLRVRRKLSQEQLAHDSEIDLTYLGGIERGKRNPSLLVLVRIADQLGVHPSKLLAE